MKHSWLLQRRRDGAHVGAAHLARRHDPELVFDIGRGLLTERKALRIFAFNLVGIVSINRLASDERVAVELLVPYPRRLSELQWRK